jgi:hypothetical protein
VATETGKTSRPPSFSTAAVSTSTHDKAGWTLEAGEFEDLEDIAKANGVDRSYVGRMLQLTSLAPDVVELILAGQAFADISLRQCRKGFSVCWEEQRRAFISTK